MPAVKGMPPWPAKRWTSARASPARTSRIATSAPSARKSISCSKICWAAARARLRPLSRRSAICDCRFTIYDEELRRSLRHAPLMPAPCQSSIVNRKLTTAAIIPARFDSVRFPGKVLADRTGKPLIQHVYERARLAKLINRIIVATDDERIAKAVKSFGGEATMTRRDHPNGTSRIAEAAQHLDADIIVNVQGDEPEIEPKLIDLAIQTLIDHPDCPVATLASPFSTNEDAANPNIVKVVVDQRGQALYFSRALIPFERDSKTVANHSKPLKHVGLYVYRREFLPRYVALRPTPLEQAEKLEQLRILEHGYSIAIAIGEAHSHGIDTPRSE